MSLKYIILLLFAIASIFGMHPTIPLLKSYVAIAILPLAVAFMLKRDLIYMLLLYFFFILFTKIGKLPLPMLPDISADRLIWIIIFVTFILEVIFHKRDAILPFTGMEISMVLFSIVCISSMFFAGTFYSEEEGLTLSFFLNAYGLPFTIFFLAKNIVNDEAKIRKVFIFFTIIGLYIGLTGIFEYFQLKQFVFPNYIMNRWTGSHWGRARGPFLNASVNGTVIGMIIFMVINLLLVAKTKWKKQILILTLITMLITLLYTLTRACWASFFLAAAAVSIYMPQVRRIFIPAMFVLIVVFSMVIGSVELDKFKDLSETEMVQEGASLVERLASRTDNINTVSGRMDLYRLSFAMFLKSPLYGHGYGSFQSAKKDFISRYDTFFLSRDQFIEKQASQHDTLIGILVDLGLLGTGLLLYMVYYSLNACRKLYRELPQDFFGGRNLAVIFAGAMITFLINVQIIDMRFFIFPNTFYFLIAGIVVGIKQRMTLNEKKYFPDRYALS